MSDHLFAEREHLLTLITEIRNSGAVAPANVWISPNFQNKGGKTYEYYKLTSDNPKVKHLGLGKMGSEKYRDWLARIQRRNAIVELVTSAIDAASVARSTSNHNGLDLSPTKIKSHPNYQNLRSYGMIAA